MTTKVIGLIQLTDPAAFEIYRSQVGATVEQYGGQIAFRGEMLESFWNELGCQAFNAYVELSFPRPEDARAWAASPEYQALVPIRSQAMRLTHFAVN